MINSREGEDGPCDLNLTGVVINGPFKGSSNRIAMYRVEELLTGQYNYDFHE